MSYYFVEYLRAKRALFIALILVGLFFLTCVVLRASLHDGWWHTGFDTSPTAHVTKTRLPDGSMRTVVDDPQRRTHAVIVQSPNGTVTIDATEPKDSGTQRDRNTLTMGSSTLNSTVHGDTVHTVGRYVPERPGYPLGILFLITIPMGLIVASLLGGVLSKENDEHLELAWTKPVSRERYAGSAIAVDAIAIALSQMLALAVGLLANLMFFVPRFEYDGNTGWAILMAFAVPIAWYALVTAASASLKRGPGMVIGLGWVAAVLIPGIYGVLQGPAKASSVAAGFAAVFHALTYIDPIAYLTFHNNQPGMMPWPAAAGVLCALVAGYLALAVAQWRRVEA